MCVLLHEHIRHFLNLYVVTLNCLRKYLRVIDRTSFLCVLTSVESGGRVRPLSPGVTFFNHFFIVVGIPSTFLRFLHDTWNQKRSKRKKPKVLSLSQKIILRSSDSHQKLFNCWTLKFRQVSDSQYIHRVQYLPKCVKHKLGNRLESLFREQSFSILHFISLFTILKGSP